MRLPHRDPIQLGPTAYEAFQEKEGIPSVTGFFIEDLMDVEVKPWAWSLWDASLLINVKSACFAHERPLGLVLRHSPQQADTRLIRS